MEHHGPTSWLLQLPLLPHDPHYQHVNGAVVVFIGILGFSLLANRAIKKQQGLVPSSRFSIGTIADVLVESLHNFVVGILGHHGAQKHFSFIAACFVFILLCNLLGLLPLSGSPTSNPNTTFALGICSFLYYNIMGIREHGPVGYGKHFLMGLGIAGIPIALVEMISHLVRPLSLGLRLAVNLDVDHKLAHAFQELAAWVVPVPVLIFGILVCMVQALLFTILTTVYVQMATEHEEEGH